ncbi:LytS/YhcK type 5TM receptor domain-containing protein [Gudongella sp. SC589]|uniref:LytS/YhcK type 5TM receptor domain-containing protein n=1 Tax=Gudongella sp. SC589 TaxID=3385990 RepID=UPI003904DAB5
MEYLSLENLINRVGLILILAFLLSRLGMFRKLVSKRKISLLDKLALALIFGSFGIIGTYTGIHIQGAIANSRVIGVFVGGLLGGPFVGILSGIIAGGHRYLIDIGGFTALACAVSTISEGAMAGFLKKRFDHSKHRFTFALMAGFAAEVLQMVIILLMAKPYGDALELVEIIGIPMILANGLGIAVFIAMVDSVLHGMEKEASYQAQLALKIANRTMFFRDGFNGETAMKTAEIIKEMTNVEAVAFTDRERIIAHVGEGEDHHKPGIGLMTELTRKALHSDSFTIADSKQDIGCDHKGCKLRSAIIVPIKQESRVIGALKLYKAEERSITMVETELALGLAQLFSTQLELSRIDQQRELLAKSELKALQAQINPHFLFNAINTIVSYTRTQPDEARKLLVHLGDFFRSNLQEPSDKVPLTKEIEHIVSYVEIEKARHGDKLKINYEILPEVECEIPPLLLQPLVENAIKHGVLHRLEGGNVTISARNNNQGTIIEVVDNGVGIPEDTLDRLLNDCGPRDCIGLRNVHDRLINLYGKDYGLQITSREDEGTRVRMFIPNGQEVYAQ